MPDLVPGAVEDEEAGRVAALGGLLRDQLLWQVVVQLVCIHPVGTLASRSMHDAAWQRVQDRLAEVAATRTQPSDVDAALERARTQIEALAQASASLEATLPGQVGDAVRDGI